MSITGLFVCLIVKNYLIYLTLVSILLNNNLKFYYGLCRNSEQSIQQYGLFICCYNNGGKKQNNTLWLHCSCYSIYMIKFQIYNVQNDFQNKKTKSLICIVSYYGAKKM